MMIGYVAESDLTAYAAARGITLARPPAETLQQALDYLELQEYSGEKTDESQVLEFPRNGSTAIPAKIEQAQLVAAVIYDSGQDPMGPIGRRVTQETVAGAVSVSYSDSGPLVALYPQLTALLRPYLAGVGGTQFRVVRG